MKRDHLLLAILFAAQTAMIAVSNAQTLYKCGKTYTDTPCPGAATLHVPDANVVPAPIIPMEKIQRGTGIVILNENRGEPVQRINTISLPGLQISSPNPIEFSGDQNSTTINGITYRRK